MKELSIAIVFWCLVLLPAVAAQQESADPIPDEPLQAPERAPLDAFQLNKGVLQWKWDGGQADPGVTAYVLDCGKTSGQYTIHQTYTNTQFEVPMKISPGGPSPAWYCTITPMYGAVRGVASPEYPFALSGSVTLIGVSR